MYIVRHSIYGILYKNHFDYEDLNNNGNKLSFDSLFWEKEKQGGVWDQLSFYFFIFHGSRD